MACNLKHFGVNMNTVRNNVECYTGICQPPARDADLAMVDTGHRIKEMRHMSRTGGKCTIKRLGIGSCVPDRNDPALLYKLPDQLDPALNLRRKRCHVDTAFQSW